MESEVRQSRLEIVPMSFARACEFVAEHHRHHKPPVGHKFSIGVEAGGKLVGVAIVGRPVARGFDNGRCLEVIRTATDGTPNANSCLYGAAQRAAFALGYTRLITYTRSDEGGVSLSAANWKVIGERAARSWAESSKSRPRKDKTEVIARKLWEVQNAQ